MQKSCLLNLSVTHPRGLVEKFQKIGFESIGNNDPVILTDESITLCLTQSDNPLLTLLYYSDDIELESRLLNNSGIDYRRDGESCIQFQSGEGLSVQIRDISTAPKTLFHFVALHSLTEDQIFNPISYPNGKIGIFNELDLPTRDLEASKMFWEKLGFDCIEYHTGPYPWGVFGDGMMHIGIHQTQDFSHAMITYSAPDMQNRVSALQQESGLRITRFEGAHRSLHKYQLKIDPACRFFLFSF